MHTGGACSREESLLERSAADDDADAAMEAGGDGENHYHHQPLGVFFRDAR
jgi:hypothetical protein